MFLEEIQFIIIIIIIVVSVVVIIIIIISLLLSFSWQRNIVRLFIYLFFWVVSFQMAS